MSKRQRDIDGVEASTHVGVEASTKRCCPPEYWSEDAGDFACVPTRYMRRKIEYLLRASALHPHGCADRAPLKDARVVRVLRVENRKLWQRYQETKSRFAESGVVAQTPESSRPIRCDIDDDERFLFHGTTPEIARAIATEGFQIPEEEHGRYGMGAYFSDQACKAHQYAGFTKDRYGGKIFSMLYCRVLPGRALSFKRTGKALASRGWLHGMISPRSGDPVFDAQMRACGLTARAKEAFDSIEVRPRARDESQIHREFVVFDESQVYPEFIVQYRTDTPEEEARLVRKKEREELVSSAFLMTCTNNTTLQFLACLLLLHR
jgi:hypothetical protein